MFNAVLAEIGWDQGLPIPEANAENKALEDELRKREKEKLELENRLGQHKDRIQAMSDQMKQVRQALGHTEELCKARERQAEGERHFKAIAEREAGRLRQEMGKLQNELQTLKEKQDTQENYITRATQKIEDLRNQLHWDQQTLDAWLEESARKDEDTMAIVKYAQQDESRIKALTVALEKKALEANKKRKALDNEVTETTSAQIQLDKTAENFHQAHLERQELISRWENTIEEMRKRDVEMQQCALHIAEVNQAIRDRNATVKEKEVFLEDEVENNRETERKIAAAKRLGAKLKLELQEEETNRIQLQDELASIKLTVDRTATDIESVRSQISSMKKDVQDKTAKLNVAKTYNAGLEEKLKAVTETALSGEERANQMERLMKEEELALKEMDVQVDRHRQALFRQNQSLQALRVKEKDLLAQLSEGRIALSGLDSQLRKLDQTSLRQQEVICNQDLKLVNLEKKLGRLRGDKNMEEKKMLEEKTAELTAALEEKKKTLNLLTVQVKKQQDDIRCVKKEIEKTGAERKALTTKIEELNLFHNTSEKELKKLKTTKQDTMVEDNLLKLEVKRLRDLLYSRADSVLSLETRRLQLHTSMKEREEEIKIHREMLTKQISIFEQERQGLSGKLSERLLRIDKMRKRYEVLTISMAPPEGEEEKSQAYYIIKAAQDRELLQRQGDALDLKIRKAEKEIRALENTIHLINRCNTAYRKSISKVQETSEEYQEKVQLEEQKRTADEKYRHKKRQIKELQEDIKDMNNAMESLLGEECEQNEQIQETQSHILKLNKDLASQREKLHRATKQCSRLVKEIRSARGSKEETFEEKDIQLRELKEFNRTINKMLLEAMDDTPDLRPALETYFLQANLPLPSPASTPSSRQSSKASTPRSSASLRSPGVSDRSSPRVSSGQSLTSRTVELGLGLSVTSPALSNSPRGLSTASSTSSSTSSTRGKSP